MGNRKIRRNSEIKMEVLSDLFIKIYGLFRLFLRVFFGKQKKRLYSVKTGII